MASCRRNSGEVFLPAPVVLATHILTHCHPSESELAGGAVWHSRLPGDVSSSGMCHDTLHFLLANYNKTVILQVILAYTRGVPCVSLGKEKSH